MIDVNAVSFRYNEDWVYRNVSFDAEPGETVAILGPNGRGKTTLLKSVIGLLKPSGGTIKLGGRPGYVAQRIDIAFAYMTIDIVVMGRTADIGLFRSPDKNDYRIAHEALERLKIDSFAKRPFNRLSGGERQLVMIARALASECEILILDEPASALDFKNQDIILSTLRDVSKANGLTVLLTTHFPQHALHLADKALLMLDTENYRWGTTEEVLTERELENLYELPIRAVSVEHNGRESTTLTPLFS